jgi:hypothetical protein
MHASLPKEFAYNQRILKAGEEIDGINCDLADFLTGLSTNPEEPIIICVNTGESMKRHEQNIGVQLWIHSDRQMSATNIIPLGMKNDAASAALVAVVEAVEWKHALDIAKTHRKGQRVVIYPPSLDKLPEVLVSGDTSRDPEPSHESAYLRVFAACASFETVPGFFSSDSQEFGGLDIHDKVPQWTHTAKEISVGGRRQVLEDGNDVCDSESDSENEEHGDELKGGYVGIPVDEHGDPICACHKLSPEQAAALRWEAQQSKGIMVSTTRASAAGTHMPTTHSPPLRGEKLTPVNSDDEDSMTEDQKRQHASALKRSMKANTRGLPATSRFEGAGEQSQAST